MSRSHENDGLRLLHEFAAAFNRHDVDALMKMMTEDCIFDSPAGTEAYGTRYEGKEAVRAVFKRIFESSPDAQWRDARHVVAGERGLSEWTFTSILPDGKRVHVNGCDVFTIRDGRIAIKNAFRKDRAPAEPQP
jgi:steroid delta-isomerase-like uncharacterized protein